MNPVIVSCEYNVRSPCKLNIRQMWRPAIISSHKVVGLLHPSERIPRNFAFELYRFTAVMRQISWTAAFKAGKFFIVSFFYINIGLSENRVPYIHILSGCDDVSDYMSGKWKTISIVWTIFYYQTYLLHSLPYASLKMTSFSINVEKSPTHDLNINILSLVWSTYVLVYLLIIICRTTENSFLHNLKSEVTEKTILWQKAYRIRVVGRSVAGCAVPDSRRTRVSGYLSGTRCEPVGLTGGGTAVVHWT
jgi:hypothetical protein